MVEDINSKPKVPYKFTLDPAELLKYQRIHIKDLELEKSYPFRYIEVEIIEEPMRGQGYHLMSIDTAATSKEDYDNVTCVSAYGMDKDYDFRHY